MRITKSFLRVLLPAARGEGAPFGCAQGRLRADEGLKTRAREKWHSELPSLRPSPSPSPIPSPMPEQPLTRPSATLSPLSRGEGLSTAIAVVAFVLALAWSSSAHAQCPDAVNTAPVPTPAPTNGQLSWSIANGVAADSFNVYFGEQGSGCNTLALRTSQGGSNFFVEYFDLAPNTTYEWRVEAIKSGCPTISSTCSSFRTVCSTTGPTLISPPNGATDDHLKTTFAWDPVLGAVSYDVFVSIAGAPPTKVGSTAGTELTVDIPPGMHNWFVEAVFGGDCAPARSVVQTFGTSCPTTAPELVSPSAGQRLSSPRDVRFEWTAVSGMDGYDVFAARDGAPPVKIGETREGVALAGTTITATLPGPGNYTWFVDGLSSGCPSRRSPIGTFVIADNCPTTPPSPTAPVNTNVTGDVQFSWVGVPDGAAAGLTGYNLWIAVGNAEPAIFANTPDTTFTTRVPPGSHSWFVDAVFAECPRLRSSTAVFTVTAQAQCPAAGPGLDSPPNEAVGVASPVNFSWMSVANARFYAVFAGVNGAMPEKVAEVTETFASVLLPSGTVRWYVEAYVEGCDVLRSETRTFTITLPPACPTTGPQLVEPESNTSIIRGLSDPPISLTWKAVTGAQSYTITIIRNGVASVIHGIEETLFSNHLALEGPGGYEWFVTANFEGACQPVESEHRFFTSLERPPCTLTAPTLIAPSPAMILNSQTVKFSWTEVRDVTSYRVFARLDPNEPPEFVASTPGGGDTEVQVTLPFGPNEWYVEVIGGRECTPAKSVTFPFQIQRAIICNSRPVVLQSPPGEARLTGPVQLVWDAVSGASGYQAFVVAAGGSATQVTDVTTELSAAITVPAGEYEWYVVSYFPGCDPATSDRRRFFVTDCDLRAPSLTSPLDASEPLTSPVNLGWTPVSRATSYDVFVGVDGVAPSRIATVSPINNNSDETRLAVSLPKGSITWFVRARVPNCSDVPSATGSFTVTGPPPCTDPTPPIIAVQPEVSSAQPYPVVWPQVPNATSYEIDEATTPDFADATTRFIVGTQETFSHGATIDTTYFYRVRPRTSCIDALGPNSNIVSVTVRAPVSSGSTLITSVGSQQTVVQSIFIPGTPGMTLRFTARTDQPWLHVSPPSGELPPAGTTISVQADPVELQTGENTATVIIDIGTFSKAQIGTTPTTTVPVSINLVSPVLPTGKDSPTDDSLIIPAVASTSGVNNSFFQSDVRVANVSAAGARYKLLFTPSGADGLRVGQQATIDVAAGETIALDNILRTWFGGGPVENVTGILEIRPLKTGAAASQVNRSRSTIGSSRTFNSTPNGTLGTYIPAVPLSKFAARGVPLTLLQVAESNDYRTNLGVVEGSGNAVSVRITAFDGRGVNLLTREFDLKPGEHRQINSLLRSAGITTDNARFSVEVTAGNGRVTAYTSTIDNRTNDPLLVEAAETTAGDSSLVLPGIADIDTPAARWRSDVRLFNPGSSTVNASLLYYPAESPSTPKQIQVAVGPAEIAKLDDILRSRFGTVQSGGAIHVRTPSNSPLIASARTYTDTGAGTYGQFIPAVSLKNAAGRESGAIHALQLEESSAFRSNVGIAEMSGKSATVEVTAVLPNSKITPRVTFELQPNQFRQLNGVLGQMGLGATYNARVAVRVIDGDGRITAYAATIDNKTQDPTFVPAQ
jgi:hypothetical protein